MPNENEMTLEELMVSLPASSWAKLQAYGRRHEALSEQIEHLLFTDGYASLRTNISQEERDKAKRLLAESEALTNEMKVMLDELKRKS